MSLFNVSQNHPLIPSAQEYVIEKKYVTIHSEDRDLIKYPDSSEFEVELPQDYLNVSTVKLSTWTFPANYNTFSPVLANSTFYFKFDNIYNPGENGLVGNALQTAIFTALYNYVNPLTGLDGYVAVIETGFYTPQQMATELMNQMNRIVTTYLTAALTKINPTLVQQFVDQGGYTDFVVAYNEVNQKLWYGNRSSSFTLLNEKQVEVKRYTASLCADKESLPDDSILGLPSYIGFGLCNASSITTSDPGLVRFYYSNSVLKPNDNGYWLTPNPNLPGAKISFVEAPFKINNMGPAYFYMEIAGLNCIDECNPFVFNRFTTTTNQTSGRVNSAFAKIGITATPLSQWFDLGSEPYKYFNPPAERIRRLKIKLRYHDGGRVNFGKFNYSFMLEFTMFRPQTIRQSTTTPAYK